MDIDIVPVLEHYGFDISDPEPGDCWTKVLCEFHGESNPSASYNQFAFNCFACGVKGDAIALIMGEEDLDFAGAVEFAERILGEGIKEVPRRTHSGRRRVSDGAKARSNGRGNRAVSSGGRRRPASGP